MKRARYDYDEVSTKRARHHYYSPRSYKDYRREYKPKLILNTRPCQYSDSKTKVAIRELKKLKEEYLYKRKTHISIIYTNNSLLETKQWLYRLKEEGINSKILSSDRLSDFKNIKDVVYSVMRDYRNIPDVIVMCSNHQRAKDMLKFIKMFNENPMTQGLFEFTIMFDEIDKPMNFSNYRRFHDKYSVSDKTLPILAIHFITATATPTFLAKLYRLGIRTLDNLNEMSIAIFNDSYRKFTDHKIILTNSRQENAVKYVEDIIQYNIEGHFDGTPRILAPAEWVKKTHYEMVEMGKKWGYTVLLINGEHKQFYYPSGDTLTLYKFAKRHGLQDKELCQQLSKFNELNPDMKLLITGNMCLERGVTIITIGFQVTHAIYSDNILGGFGATTNITQFIGRSSGGTKYVEKHRIYMSEYLLSKIEGAGKYYSKIHFHVGKFIISDILMETEFRMLVRYDRFTSSESSDYESSSYSG